jgi:hypothetical protein
MYNYTSANFNAWHLGKHGYKTNELKIENNFHSLISS